MMGIVKISEELHEKARIACKAMTRSINAQAEHWMKVGMLVEENPNMSYMDVLKHMMDEARQIDREEQEKAQKLTKRAG